MSRAWQLPEFLADVLPAQALHLESLRRQLLDGASRYGFELVVPPLLEHLDSLMSASGGELELQTFKLVDQLSGRTLGLRADTTPQAARIDAHLLNRDGITRLCYCGPVLHTRPSGVANGRELLQFGAEVFGYAGLEADLEVQELALDLLAQSEVGECLLDLADARLLRGILQSAPDPSASPSVQEPIIAALGRKDGSDVDRLSQGLPGPLRDALRELTRLHGGVEVLESARSMLPRHPLIGQALDDLQWLAQQLQQSNPGLRVGFDLSDVGGYGYYTATRFAVYCAGSADAVARGGRYDEVGAAFGRNRPAVGFSMDVKALAALRGAPAVAAAIRAPWSGDPTLRDAVRRLRQAGETVVVDLPGTASQECARVFDRELAQVAGRWVLRDGA